ncbi:alpha/beta fold hydrolase [Promicromonospora thailandica]|uniref:Pimeloyl-ACP methyl ester carboxylesterase n=1 Tax=Promicromonospora thailandica TaxID=765201 RepID=A0A9X2G3V7_9MICO|nr:alpha/beta hydrolase [Promicromonospora thailandica]MCP2266590.1 Pimeloyl-ACP methyl ester carboxylesterase [Promicromonospora thailandica]BFF17335.1 alpha/beta hydrolase [Promicromonospora thailandica]
MNLKRSLLAAGVALAAAFAVGTAPALAGGKPTGPEKPTVVLVHGAFADSSSWNGVLPDLQRKGYPVIAPANPLRGLHSDAAYLRSVLDTIDGPIVLAGHSYGGSVLSEAAAGDPDVKALVYIASFQLDVGESTAELAGKFPGGQLGAALDQRPFPTADGGTGTDLYVQPAQFRRVFAADVPRRTTDLMAATQRPIAESALADTATQAAWKTIPSWSLITTQDLTIPLRSMRFMSDRAGSHSVEIKASHAVAVSRPHAVSGIIDTAARATAR